MNRTSLAIIVSLSFVLLCCGDDPDHEEGLTITTLAGYADDAPGTVDATGADARFAYPSGIAVDADGNLYVTDTNIRKITPEGVVTTLAVTTWDGPLHFSGPTDIACDEDGNLYVSELNSEKVYRISRDGYAQYVGIPFAGSVVVDHAGTVYAASLSRVFKITSGGEITVYAGSDQQSFADGDPLNARFTAISGMDIDDSGNLYVSDRDGHIRKVSAAGVTTISGSDSEFTYPSAVAVDPSGIIYVSDRILKKDLTNTTAVYVIKRIDSDGSVKTVAGGEWGFADGHGSKAQFRNVYDLAIDKNGVVYMTDTEANTVRKGIFE